MKATLHLPKRPVKLGDDVSLEDLREVHRLLTPEAKLVVEMDVAELLALVPAPSGTP